MADRFFQPISGLELPRFAGIAAFMRLQDLPDDHPALGRPDRPRRPALGRRVLMVEFLCVMAARV